MNESQRMPAHVKAAWVALIVALALQLTSGGGIVIPTPGPPAPIPAPGLHVLIVEETQDRSKLPPSQLTVITSDTLREVIRAKQGSLRVLDQNAPLENEEPLWRDAMALPRQSLPWLIVSDGKSGYSGPLPTDLSETMKIVGKYAK